MAQCNLELSAGTLFVSPGVRSGDASAHRWAARRTPNYVFKLTKQLAAIAVGQNLLQAAHAEFSPVNTALSGSIVPRSGRFQLRWQF
jgi:hypothetical protein